MKTLAFLVAKVALTLCLFALVLRSVDIGDVVLHIRRLPAETLLLVTAIWLAQLSGSAIRLSAITGIIAYPIPLTKALRMNWVGAFFAQALVTFVSGDVIRTMMLHRCAIPMRNCARCVTLDRLIGPLGRSS
jgi:uncharacterized membrane protein YbhN (UPF0104 family)